MILAHWHRLKQAQIAPVVTDVEFVTSAGFDTDNNTTHTLTGLQSGDFVLLQQTADAGDPTLHTGWTNIDLCSATIDIRWSYRFSTGTSVSFTADDRESAVMAAFRNVNQSTPFDVTPTSNFTVGSGTSKTPSSITTVTDKCMIVVGIGIDDVDQTSATISTGYTTATSVYGGDTGGGSDGATTIVIYKTQTSAGTESPSTISWSASEASATETIALRPA